jgi:hypothetical protein
MSIEEIKGQLRNALEMKREEVERVRKELESLEVALSALEGVSVEFVTSSEKRPRVATPSTKEHRSQFLISPLQVTNVECYPGPEVDVASSEAELMDRCPECRELRDRLTKEV